LFKGECAALSAPVVKLDFPGRKGQTTRRKSLSPDYPLSDILSEGEQTVIALADFLAEASLPKASAPIIFDDPVTSLDHQRLRYVVDRLALLSEQNQVIVFTHDIWFTVELPARFDAAPGACTYYEISGANGAKGLIRERPHPRWDTLKHIAARIS
jgi:wobble nucleotide-excising tRNase